MLDIVINHWFNCVYRIHTMEQGLAMDIGHKDLIFCAYCGCLLSMYGLALGALVLGDFV